MNTPENDHFKEIRPYYDHEVNTVVQEVIHNEELIRAICQFRFPRLHNSLGFVLRPLIRHKLKRQFAAIETVACFQGQIADYMNRMIRNTCDGFTISGLDQLDPSKPYLFVANHRDIAMDPAFVNYALYQQGRNTVRIAIGDNLLQKPYISDLMRLNKSFIVKRSAKGVREMMKSLTQLSGYINHSLLEEKHSIWIAQKEGRAKNGIDLTDPAIIKMFYMSRKKKGSGPTFSEVINELNIVPVTISYEYDPCDGMKARELNALATEGRYNKVEFEDIDSIVKGISGYKGRVHVHFDQPLNGEFADAHAAAAQINRQIWDNYRFYPTNWLALEKLGGHSQVSDQPGITDSERAQFEQHLADIPQALHTTVLKMYANPVLNSRGLLDSGS